MAQIAPRYGPDCARHFRRRPDQVVNQLIDGRHFIGPVTGDARHGHALLEFALAADRARHPSRFERPALADRDNLVERVGDLALDADEIGRHPRCETTIAERQHRGQKLPRKWIGGGRR